MLNDTDMLQLAGLANLSLEEGEIASLKKDLSEVIGHFSELKNINTKDIPATSQTTGLVNITRKDRVDASLILTVGQATSGTEAQNGYFEVPGLLDKDAL